MAAAERGAATAAVETAVVQRAVGEDSGGGGDRGGDSGGGAESGGEAAARHGHNPPGLQRGLGILSARRGFWGKRRCFAADVLREATDTYRRQRLIIILGTFRAIRFMRAEKSTPKLPLNS
jgi:hypothetical protein